MTIYYETGSLSLWSAAALDDMPRTAVRKVVKLISANMNRAENEECTVIFCEWLTARITAARDKSRADRADKKAESALKFYCSLAAGL